MQAQPWKWRTPRPAPTWPRPLTAPNTLLAGGWAASLLSCALSAVCCESLLACDMPPCPAKCASACWLTWTGRARSTPTQALVGLRPHFCPRYMRTRAPVHMSCKCRLVWGKVRSLPWWPGQVGCPARRGGALLLRPRLGPQGARGPHAAGPCPVAILHALCSDHSIPCMACKLHAERIVVSGLSVAHTAKSCWRSQVMLPQKAKPEVKKLYKPGKLLVAFMGDNKFGEWR